MMIPDCEPNYGYLICGACFILAALVAGAVVLWNLVF